MATVSIIQPEFSSVEIPLYQNNLRAGFPSPADEYMGESIDLNEYLISNKTATFFAKVEGDSMINAGIFEGDLLVIDRSKKPVQNSVVIAAIDNEFTVKRLCLKEGIRLMPENDDYEPIKLTGLLELKVWGVVTSVVRKL